MQSYGACYSVVCMYDTCKYLYIYTLYLHVYIIGGLVCICGHHTLSPGIKLGFSPPKKEIRKADAVLWCFVFVLSSVYIRTYDMCIGAHIHTYVMLACTYPRWVGGGLCFSGC